MNPAYSARNREIPRIVFTVLLALSVLMPAPARADDDLPPRIGRVAEMGGELFLAPEDAADQWVAIGINYPVATGDNLWVGNEGRAEIDFGSGQLRLAGDTSVHLSRLDDRNLALFVAQGRVILRIRVLDPGEAARIDTPNAQIALSRPGLYRIEVTEDRQHTQIAVREGEAILDTGAAVQQVLPGQSASLDGAAPQYAQLRNGVTTDGFDTWSANRDRHYERSRVNSPVSRQMVGAADLDEYGAWETAPDYGAVWYPANVAEDWAPYRNGYWTDVAAWGPTWVDAAPWGYAPFHYGRWVHFRGRWGWCPGAYDARPVWAPALVGWIGGPGWRGTTNRGAPVYGWVPLGWGEAYHPRWKGCSDGCWARYNQPYAVNTTVRPSGPPARWANAGAPGAVSAVPGSTLAWRKPVAPNLVAISGSEVASAPVLAAPVIRPENRQAPGIRPGNGVPLPASASNPVWMRQPRPVPPAGAVAGEGGTAAAPPVPRATPGASATVNAVPAPAPSVAKPPQRTTTPTVSTNIFPAPRPQPILVNPPASTTPVAASPAGEPKSRIQPTPVPGAFTPVPAPAPNAFAGQGGVALPKPVPAPVPMREPRAVQTLPVPAAPPQAPLPAPQAAHPVPTATAPRAVPGAPVAVVPGGHPSEVPKVEKAISPAVKAPADVPVK